MHSKLIARAMLEPSSIPALFPIRCSILHMQSLLKGKFLLTALRFRKLRLRPATSSEFISANIFCKDGLPSLHMQPVEWLLKSALIWTQAASASFDSIKELCSFSVSIGSDAASYTFSLLESAKFGMAEA